MTADVDEGRDTPDAAGSLQRRVVRARDGLWRVLRPRLVRLTASLAAGLLMCLAFPPFGQWYSALAAAAPLAWVLRVPATTKAGGFGYGFLFGLAFYLPLLPWISGLVGTAPWVGLGSAAHEAVLTERSWFF